MAYLALVGGLGFLAAGIDRAAGPGSTTLLNGSARTTGGIPWLDVLKLRRQGWRVPFKPWWIGLDGWIDGLGGIEQDSIACVKEWQGRHLNQQGKLSLGISIP